MYTSSYLSKIKGYDMKTVGIIFAMYITVHGALNWATDYRDALQAKHTSYTYLTETKGTK